jgi:hypothetical protein
MSIEEKWTIALLLLMSLVVLILAVNVLVQIGINRSLLRRIEHLERREP